MMDKVELLKYFTSPVVLWDLIFEPSFNWWLFWYDNHSFHHRIFYDRGDALQAMSDLHFTDSRVIFRDQILRLYELLKFPI